MRPARHKPRRSGPALVVSLGVHALVLAALLLSVRAPPSLIEAPPVQVSLIDLAPSDPILRRAPLPPPPPILKPRAAPVPPVDAPPPPPELRGAAERGPPTPAPQAEQRGERAPYMSFFQDNLKGCEREALMLMAGPDQERCRARIAAAALQQNRPFRAAPQVEGLSALSAARRAVLDAEVARRARSGAPMTNPVGACEGRLANLGVGCLPAKDD